MTGNILLILDLDETLIFGTGQPLTRPADFRVGPFFVYKRPFVADFLDACARDFDLAVWTSSSPNYAQAIVAALFPDPANLAFVWASDRCTLAFNLETGERHWRKDLKKVRRRGYNLNRVLVIDDSPEKLKNSYGNLVQVKPFEGNESDDELRHLTAYLGKLQKSENVRTIEKRHWRMLTERKNGHAEN